jgi:hypothetical protein
MPTQQWILSPLCIPFHHTPMVDSEGVEPSSLACNANSLPLTYESIKTLTYCFSSGGNTSDKSHSLPQKGQYFAYSNLSPTHV